MGITIDKHMENLLDMMDSMPDDACGDWRDSLSYAIDTMHKYQKIEQAYSVYLETMNPDTLADLISTII